MQLKIGTSVIPLKEGTSLPIVLRSPLFLTDKGTIPGSYIFNFPVPAGDAIRSEFGQAHRLQRHGRATAELDYVLSDGLLRYQGKCLVTEASGDEYQVACKVDNGDLAGKLSGKTLKDLNLGGDRVIAEVYSLASAAEAAVFRSIPSNNPVIDAPDRIIMDLTGRLSNKGKTFTADKAYPSLTVKITAHIEIDEGTIFIEARKNGITFLGDFLDASHPDKEMQHTISLQVNDAIIVDVSVDEDADPDEKILFMGENFRLSVEYSTANIFNTVFPLDQDGADFAIFPIYNEKFLNNFPDDAFQLDNLSLKTIYSRYFRIQNYFKDGEFPLYLQGTIEGESLYCANLFTPFVYLNTILFKIASEAGYSIVNNPFSGEFKNAVLFNAYADNNYVSDSTTLVPLKPTFNLSDHVPEIGQNDFIKYISVLTGCMPLVDNNQLTITFVDLKDKKVITNANTAIPFPGIISPEPLVRVEPDYKGIRFEMKKAGRDEYLNRILELNPKLVFKGSVTTLTDLPATGNSINDMYLVTFLNEYYVFQYNPEAYILTWWFYSKNFPIIYTEGEEPFMTVTSELSPVLTSHMLDETPGAPARRTWWIPRTEQAGILEGFPESLGTEYGLQVLYYKGMAVDSHSQPYPLGSCRYADYPGNLTFFPDLSAESLFNHRYKGFLQWLAYETKSATLKAILTRKQLSALKFDQVYSAAEYNFLIKEVRVNLLPDGLSETEIDIYTV